jgi:serine/threonine protein kinase/Flp pilus assembly protein TadD
MMMPTSDCESSRGRRSSRRNAPRQAAADFVQARSIKRALMHELDQSHAAGKPVSPEELLARWPTNPADDRDVASLLFEDYCRRQRSGERPSIREYQDRFPEQRDSLISHFRQHAVMRSLRLSGSEPAPLAMPAVGDEVFGFRLRHELGAGAFASVFLAEQVSLAGRPVVLKVSASEGQEPQTLAQLQHTNIVPLYSHHENGAAGLRAVCMPFFGGASLSRVLGAIWVETSQPTRGNQFVWALQQVSAPSLVDVGRAKARDAGTTALVPRDVDPATLAPLARLEGLSYLQLSAWLGAGLADGLHHAHQRGILHRDIKPSNILIAADGQPLLLDFNLSADVKDPAAVHHATMGGTVAYMAPEHLRAMASRDPALARRVDRRSDIYSLGMVLYELLVGHKPFDQSASYAPMPALIEAMALERAQVIPSPRERRPDVPWGMESIIRKCLHPDPERRYQEAAQVAEDLRGLLENRALRHAPELSQIERLVKWTRRHPRLTTAATVGAVALVVVGLLGAGLTVAWLGWEAAHEQLLVAEEREQVQQFNGDAVRAFALVCTIADLDGLDHQRAGMDLCKKNLDVYHVLDRDDWQDLPGWQRLDDERRAHLLESVREVLMLYAWARARGNDYRAGGLQDALGLLDRAQAIAGLAPTPALWQDRAFYLEKLGRAEDAMAARAQAAVIPPSTARDHYLLAVTRIRAEGPASSSALAALDQALALNPQHYWALMQRGACRLDSGDTLLAVSDFSEAIRLQPDGSLGYFNRGYALARGGRHAAAIADYARALDCDSGMVIAYLNRGLIYLERKEHAAALADFDRAIALGRDDASLHMGRGVALEGLGRSADADAAFAKAMARLDRLEARARLRILWAHGFAVAARRPAEAAASFDAVLAAQPRQPQALYGKAMLAAQQDEVEAALGYFQRALEADPTFVEARRYRAILYARCGQLARASQDINLCLEKEPQSGATLYAAACVAALALDHADPLHAPDVSAQALDLLEQAFRQGYGRDRAATDPDLAALRSLPRFRRLVAGGS